MNEPTNEQIFTMVNFCSIVHWQWLKTDNGDLRWSSVNIWLNLRHLSILTVAQHCMRGGDGEGKALFSSFEVSKTSESPLRAKCLN